VLDDHSLAVVYLSNDPYTRRYDLDIVDELREALGSDNVVVIGAAGRGVLDERDTWWIQGLDDVGDAMLALPFVVFAQILGLDLSLALGGTPDNPFPSGTVNRVVQGVTIRPLPE
jgi:tagatose-6-phosphate ketose/aldose isomerase